MDTYNLESYGNVKIQKLDSDVNCLCIDLDPIISRAYHDTWIKERSQREYVYVPFEESGNNTISYDMFYFIGRLKDLISDVVLYVKPKVLIMAVSGKTPLYKIEYDRRKLYSDYNNKNFVKEQFVLPGTHLSKLIDKHIKSWIPEAQVPSETTKNPRIKNKYILPHDVRYYHYCIKGESKIKLIHAVKSFPGEGYNVFYNSSGWSKFLMLAMINNIPNSIIAEEDFSSLINVENLKHNLVDQGIKIEDYSFLGTVFSNKYIPSFGIPFESIIEKYTSWGNSLIEDGSINKENFISFISTLEDSEKLRNEYYNGLLLPKGNQDLIIKFTGSPIDYKSTWGEIDVSNIVEMYINSINWFYSYYKLDDTDWEFLYPYLDPPLLEDLKLFSGELSKISSIEPCRYNIYQQLLASVDIRTYWMLPNNLHNLVVSKSDVYYMYPLNYNLYKSEPLLPPINMNIIIQTTEGIIDENEWQDYNVPASFTFIPNQKSRLRQGTSRLGKIKQ